MTATPTQAPATFLSHLPADADPAGSSHGDPTAERLDVLPPGPELAALVDEVDLASCSDETVVAVAAASTRLQSWASSVEVRATRALVQRAGRWRGVRPHGAAPTKDTVPADRIAAAEVAAALGLSSRAAQNRVALALELDRAPATKDALHRGQAPLYTVRTVLEQLRPLDDEQAAAVEAKVMDRYAGRPHADVTRALRRAVLAADPGAAEKRRKRGVEDRTLDHYPLDDGMATAAMTGPAEDVQRFVEYATAAAIAAKGPGDTRTLAQRRFDVVADLGAVALAHDTTRPDLLCHPGPAPESSLESCPGEASRAGARAARPGTPARRLPERKGHRPQIKVVVSLTTLLGLDDRPGELVGYGPVTAEVARRIAADGTWRRLLTDPRTGRFDELSVDTYEPPQDMAGHVTARDPTCIGAGCRMPADRCDLDHRIPHPRGPTSADNLEPWCRTEHRIKTITDTVVTRLPDGDRMVRYPSGRSYLLPVDPVLDHPDDVDVLARRRVHTTRPGCVEDPQSVDETDAADEPSF